MTTLELEWGEGIVKAFADIPIVERASKPRPVGLTIIHDTGLGPTAQRDFLTIAGEYVDFAKIPVGLSRLLDLDALQAKIALYKEHGVVAFPGGQFLEYAVVTGSVAEFMRGALVAGYTYVEVSDNIVSLDPKAKATLIRTAVEEYGLRVLGEVGKKEGRPRALALDDDARKCLDAGAFKVLVEAADLFRGDQDPEGAVRQLLEGPYVRVTDIIIELPGYWLPDTAYGEPLMIARRLIDSFGPEVNLANVDADKVLLLEALRRGIGTNAGADATRVAAPR